MLRTSCQITTLNPATETTSPARLIQSLTSIFTGSSAVILPKGRATFVLFAGATTLGAERDLGAGAVLLPRVISQPPQQPGGCCTCVCIPSGYHLPDGAGRHSRNQELGPFRTGGPTRRWPDFGRTALHNDARRREPVRAILAGQPPSAQVAGMSGTIYGSDVHDGPAASPGGAL